MYLPNELVEIIMHYIGAYHLNKKERPYIKDIKLIGKVSEYGVKRSLIHLKELRVLINMHKQYSGWLPPMLKDYL
jgi:hypothetical protein